MNFSVSNCGQIFHAIPNYVNGLVVFWTTCNLHCLSYYSNFRCTIAPAFQTSVVVAHSSHVYDYLRAVIHAVGGMTTYWCSRYRYSNVHLAISQMHSRIFIQNRCDLRKMKECLRMAIWCIINFTDGNLMYYGPLEAKHVLVSINVQTSTLTNKIWLVK